MSRVAPLLARHRLCVLQQVVKREIYHQQGHVGPLLSVGLLVAFDLVSARDGSGYTAKAWGEALDASDEGTAKAISSAF